MRKGLRAPSRASTLLPLVRQLRAGEGVDTAALTPAVPQLLAHLQRFAHPRLRWLADAEDAAADIAAETLARALRHWSGCRARSEAELVAWLQAIARRLILDLRRTPAPIGGAEPLVAWYVAVPVPRPHPRTTRRAQRVLALLEELEPALAALFLRRALEGTTWPELAREFSCSSSAARRRFERARRLVRARIHAAEAASRRPRDHRGPS